MMLYDHLQVGKGLIKDAKARKLAFQHWIEAVRLSLEIFRTSTDCYDHDS